MRGRGASAWTLLQTGAILFSLALAPVLAQGGQARVTNTTVIELAAAGVAPETIELIVRASASAFDTSEKAVNDLRRRGVPESVIAAMQHRSGAGTASTSRAGQSRDMVVALELSVSTATSRVEIEQAPYTSAMSYGLFSVGTKVIVPGKHARVETEEGRPSFRIELSPGRRPTGFILSRFEESDEGGARQINPESSLLFDVERLVDGAFRLTPRQSLRRGEYCLYVTEAARDTGVARLAIYDFRIVRR